MNPETTEILNGALRKAIEVASKTGEFVVQQAPDVVQQLIVWKTAAYALELVISVVFTAWMVWIIRKLHKSVDYDSYEAPPYIIGMVFAALFGACSTLFCSLPSAFALLKITLAPKVWLLEYAAALIK